MKILTDHNMRNIVTRLFSSAVMVLSMTVVPALAGQLTDTPGTEKRTVSGTVKDSDGLAIVGASIIELGGDNGVVADINGEFSIMVPDGAVLRISCIGYSAQTISVGDRRVLSVVLQEDNDELESIVVVGFSTQKKVNLTGAVEVVTAEELEGRPVSNLVQALQGLSPGLNIQQTSGMLDQTPSMNIRGVGTIGLGSNAGPLVLVDGVESSLADVNSQDVESISVLKDAASSSVYGSRAPFGVILVTTKQGEAGKVRVNYNNNFRWGTLTVEPDMMDSYTLATFMNDALRNSNQSPFVTEERLARIVAYQKGELKTRNIPNPANPAVWADGYSYGNDNHDIYDIVYKDWAFTHEHNFSASGGNDRLTYYVSLGYMDQEGLLKVAEDRFSRITPMVRVNARINDWLRLSYSTRYVRTVYDRPSHLDFDNLSCQGWAFVPTIDDNGHYGPTSGLVITSEGGRLRHENDAFNNHAVISIEPVDGWETNVEVNYNITSNTYKDVRLKTYSYNVLNDPVPYTDRSWVGNGLTKTDFFNVNIYSSYALETAGGHQFKIMAGMQAESLKQIMFGANREGVLVPDLPVVDLTTGRFDNGELAIPDVWGNSNAWSTAGFFGRFNYDYKGRYLFEANLRYDGTSRFRRDRRWNWFPSFSAGWNLAKEDFWTDLTDKVGMLKIRGSYGELGNQNTTDWYPTYTVMNVASSAGTWLQNGTKPNIASSPDLISVDLSWEKIRTWDIGLDVAAFDNRLSGTFDWFVRETLDMVGPAEELPSVLGKPVPPSNNTDLETYGFELEIGWKDQLESGFSYGVRFLLSDSQTIITRFPNATKSLSTYYEGQKLGDIWGYQTIGIAKSDSEMHEHLLNLPMGGQNALGSQWAAGDIMYKDVNGDGKIDSGSYTYDDPGDLRVIGNSSPRFLFGLDMNFSWKWFDLRLFFQGVGKRDFWTSSALFWGTNENMWYMIGTKEHADYFRAEPSNNLPANIDSYYPRPLTIGSSKNQQVQTRYLQDASYIRLKNVSLGFTLPRNFVRKLHLSDVRISVSGENLWTGTRLAGMFDPETIDGGAARSGEVYNLQKVISFGLSITL